MNTKERQFLFTTETISQNFGGLTTAMFRRANVFAEEFNTSVKVLTFKFTLDFFEVENILNNKGFTNDSVQIHNMYKFLSELKTQTLLPSSKRYPLDFEKNAAEDNYYVEKDDKGIKRKVIYYKNEKVIKIDEFSNPVSLLRRRFFEDDKLIKEHFYRRDNTIYMVKDFGDDYQVNKGKLNEIHFLNENQNIIKTFSNHTELRRYFISLMVEDHKHSVVINDRRTIDQPLIEYNEKKISKLFVIHSTHLRKPFDAVSSTIRVGNRVLFNNMNKADNVIFLTNRQKNDVVERYGQFENINVIPHFIEQNSAYDSSYENKMKNRFVIISRYHEEKQLDHIVKAFKTVKDNGFEFKVDFFGKGAEKENLKELVLELGLENEISINGFTTDPEQEFANSLGTFLTSKYEGFGLTILESLKNHCPVFSYDIKYGPSDMIEDEVNGYLIEPDNIKMLSDKIIKFLKLEEEEKRTLCQNAKDSIQKFSQHQFITRWEKAIEQSYYLSAMRHVKADLTNIYFEKKSLFIELTLTSDEVYNNLNNDLKGIDVYLNGEMWKMETSVQTKNALVYNIRIPLKPLKKVLNESIEMNFNLNFESYSCFINYGIESSLGSNVRSIGLSTYQMNIKDSNPVIISKKSITGIRSLMKYIKTM